MIGLSLASAGSGLLLIADSIVRRAGSGEAGSLAGSALGVLRTQAAGPALTMVAQLARPENLAALAGLALAAAVALMLQENVVRTARWSGDAAMLAREALVPVRI